MLGSEVKTIHEFERAIQDADTYIISYLASKYTEDELRGTQALNTTLLLFPPIGKNADGDTNDGGRLRHVTLNTGSTHYTSVWKLTFADGTDYAAYSFLEGSQGTGANNGDFDSTNGAVTINSTYWENTSQAVDDVYWFSVVRAWRIINTISRTLAAAFLINELTGDQTPEDSVIGRRWYTRAVTWLEMLRSGKMALDAASQPTIDCSPIVMPYRFDRYGDTGETATTSLTDISTTPP